MTDTQWNLVFNGFTALGTVGAVIVALLLGTRRQRSRLHVRANISYLITPGVANPEPPLFFILSAVNQGPFPVRLEGIQWNIGIVKKDYYAALAAGLRITPTLPAKLDIGDSIQVVQPIDQFERAMTPILNSIQRSLWPRLCLRFSKVAFYSPDYGYPCRLGPSLTKWFLPRLKKHAIGSSS